MQSWDECLPKKGLLVVVSGPSGVGKDAVLTELKKILPTARRCVTTTTRPPREGEVDGIDYQFISHEEFLRRVEKNEFLEHAEYCGHLYGTPRAWVEEHTALGEDVILKIDVQGALAVKKQASHSVLMFLVPPSIGELERRLRSRLTDSEEQIAGRLERACAEFEQVPNYDYVIVNDSLREAAEELKAVIVAEHCKVQH